MRDRIIKLYRDKPDYLGLLQQCTQVHRNQENRENWLGFSATDLGAWPGQLKVLENAGVLVKSYSSRRYTHWKVKDIDTIEEILGNLESGLEDTSSYDFRVPDDLFEPIVGYENIKSITRRSLESDRPVHILLIGSPSTAKSLFLQEVSRIPGARYALGSSSTRAGLVDFLLDQHPRVLIMDEIDKMNTTDMSVLLSLMETGIVTRLKHRMRETERLRSWVFAACNRDQALPPELKSRFLKFRLREYTVEEFVNVTRHVLVKREGRAENLATYIAARLSPITQDIRDAVRVARLCHSIEEVDTVVDQIWRK